MPEARTSENSKPLFDPFDERLIKSPYADYQRLRSEDPVYWCAPLRCWVLTRMQDVQAVLNDPNSVAVESSKILGELARRAGRDYEPTIRVLSAVLFFKDGQAHRRERRTIAQIMNQMPLSRLDPYIRDIAAGLVAKLSDVEEFDAVRRFADPLPQYVMAHILGIDSSDVPVLDELLSQLTRIFDPITLDICDAVNNKAGPALDLLKARIANAALSGEPNALSTIYAGTSGPESERLADAAATTLFTYRVGSETTMGLLGLIVRTLIHDRDLRRAALTTPASIPSIVAEILRLESNVQRAIRVGRQASVIGGKHIKPGERLMLLLGAANRDPAAFADPDGLRPGRDETSNVVFGGGHHFCLGASLARLEGRVGLEALLQLPVMEQAGEEEWYVGRSIRRLTRLPVRVVPNEHSEPRHA
jgi:cytochrome P450